MGLFFRLDLWQTFSMADKDWCTILVSGEKVKVDKEDLPRIEEHSWRITKGTTGRPRVVASLKTPKGYRNVTLGAFLMKPPKGKQVYPRRFNEGLDYRKGNLIVCTLKERQRLLPKKRIDASSVFRGVSFMKASGKWRAGIEVEGKALNLGDFDTEEQAALAYNKAARSHFGDVAYQNDVSRSRSKRAKRE